MAQRNRPISVNFVGAGCSRALVVGRAAQSLDVGALLLRCQAALFGAATRLGRSSRWRWRAEGVGDELGESGARGFPVAQLGAVLGGCDRKHSVGDAIAETLTNAFVL
ncbi:hypothetical protein HNR14_002895 [Leifsonia naganoensis]|uniref:Uncharacterized protein n=1 Tax=Leifsonia naganoensis TaxID=150025 RepID=A0A853DVJ5_9MICO|nr:hypothetical protein [Leifsonia naganoensis]